MHRSSRSNGNVLLPGSLLSHDQSLNGYCVFVFFSRRTPVASEPASMQLCLALLVEKELQLTSWKAHGRSPQNGRSSRRWSTSWSPPSGKPSPLASGRMLAPQVWYQYLAGSGCCEVLCCPFAGGKSTRPPPVAPG